MKKYISTFLIFASSTFAIADTYNVKVQTFVAGRLEDKFSFDIATNEIQEKGFDTKILAKRYRAEGWIHPEVVERDTAEAEAKALEEAKKLPVKTLVDTVKEKLDELERSLSAGERKSDRIQEANAVLSERIKMLQDVIDLSERNKAAFESAYAQYINKYEPKEQVDANYERLMKRRPKNTGDVEEVNLGSYCRIKLIKEGEKSIRVNIDYAYNRILSYFYSDGNNNKNSITKHPVFERFSRIGLENIKLSFAKPFCIQIGRPSPDEARTLQDAIAANSIFSNMGEKKKDAPLAVSPAYASSEFDAMGAYAEISQKYAMETGKTVRVVFTVKKEK